MPGPLRGPGTVEGGIPLRRSPLWCDPALPEEAVEGDQSGGSGCRPVLQEEIPRVAPGREDPSLCGCLEGDPLVSPVGLDIEVAEPVGLRRGENPPPCGQVGRVLGGEDPDAGREGLPAPDPIVEEAVDRGAQPPVGVHLIEEKDPLCQLHKLLEVLVVAQPLQSPLRVPDNQPVQVLGVAGLDGEEDALHPQVRRGLEDLRRLSDPWRTVQQEGSTVAPPVREEGFPSNPGRTKQRGEQEVPQLG